jgi:hypothetical protein
MLKNILFSFVLALLLSAPAISNAQGKKNYGEPRYSQPPPAAVPPQAQLPEDKQEKKRKGHPVLCYIPNRIFDALDIVRARVRIGPGYSIGARATELVDVFFGAHSTMYVGLRGSRGKPEIPWPIGVEYNQGLEVSLIDNTSASPDKPVTDPLEFGVETQFLMAGFNVSIEVAEIFDFITGFFLIDLRKDDF